MTNVPARRDPALALLSFIGVVAFALAVIDYANPNNGIHGSEGVVLVMVSTGLLALTALLLWFRVLRGWVGGLFEILIVLDFAGTGAAAYLLEDWLLVALMGLGFIVWLVHRARPQRPLPTATG